MVRRKVSTSPIPDKIDRIIAREQRAKTDAIARNRQNKGEEKRQGALLNNLLAACKYGMPLGPDAQNWVMYLGAIFETAAPYVQGEIIARIPKRGDARRILKRVCGLIRSKEYEKAEETLAKALDTGLKTELWEDLTEHFPQDVVSLLPEELRERFQEMRAPRTATVSTPTARTAASKPSEPGTSFEMITGGFRLYGINKTLPGKPFGVLRSLYTARHRRRSFSDLRSEVWGQNDFAANEQNAKDAVSTLRRAIRTVYESAKGVGLEGDPVPCVGKGPDLAWELKLDLLK